MSNASTTTTVRMYRLFCITHLLCARRPEVVVDDRKIRPSSALSGSVELKSAKEVNKQYYHVFELLSSLCHSDRKSQNTALNPMLYYKKEKPMNENKEIAVFGGGCFWCTEAVFNELRGVGAVMPGYAGGSVANPTYEQVSDGNTGHAEVTRVEFDPSVIAYKDLLTIFFGSHNPTTLNRQGNDVGTQYRSIILYTNAQQKTAAEKYIAELNASGDLGAPVVTKVEPLTEFYAAEDYHQKYYERNASQPYCQVVIDPKLAKLREKFAAFLKTAPKK